MFDSAQYWRRIFIAENLRRFSRLGHDRLRYVTPRYLKFIGQTVVVTPLIMGFISAYLFAVVPQMQEVYLGIIEKSDFGRGLGGLAAISLFAALLYSWNHTMVTERIDAIYPDHADIYFDRGVINVRDLKTLFASSLPFLGLIAGLFNVRYQVGQAGPQVENVSRQLSAVQHGTPLLDQLQSLPEAINISVVLTVLIYLCFLACLHRSRWKTGFHQRLLYACYGLSFIVIAVPMAASNTTIIAARVFGPLIGTALVLIAGAVLMRFLFLLLGVALRLLVTLPSALAMAATGVPLPVGTLLVVLAPLIVVGLSGTRAGKPMTRETETRSTLDMLAKGKEGNDTLGGVFRDNFKAWLAARKGNFTGKYPVFIVTAEGGGIYAASAASYFLATMQDHCPAFAKHVFAVSAVSGGSVGVSLFNAAFTEKHQRNANGLCQMGSLARHSRGRKLSPAGFAKSRRRIILVPSWLIFCPTLFAASLAVAHHARSPAGSKAHSTGLRAIKSWKRASFTALRGAGLRIAVRLYGLSRRRRGKRLDA